MIRLLLRFTKNSVASMVLSLSKHGYLNKREVMEEFGYKDPVQFKIRTDRVTEARRIDIVLIDKENQEMFIIEVAISGILVS